MQDPGPFPWASILHRVTRAAARGPTPTRLLGAASFGKPVRAGPGWEVDMLLLVDPLPPPRHRFAWLQVRGPLRVHLIWKGTRALLYPSPRYLELLHRGRILHDPAGLLAATLERLLAGLADRDLTMRRVEPFPCWSLREGWPDGPLTGRLRPADGERGGRGPGP